MKKYLAVLFLLLISLTAICQWNSNSSINTILSNGTVSENIIVSVSDGANGNISFFSDFTVNGDFYAQKISAAGIVAWGSISSPVPICITTSEKNGLNAIPDGSGGAFIAWRDYRNDPLASDIYIQRINSAGLVQWAANGVRVTNNATQNDLAVLLCTDGAGGIIITWQGDDNAAQNIQTFAQRFNSTGIAQWAANGVMVCTAPGFRWPSHIAADGSNGAFIFFTDTRNDPNGLNYSFTAANDFINTDIYGQRLNGSGVPLWTNNGSAIITAAGNQNNQVGSGAIPQGNGGIIPDGSGGVILVFDDGRNEPPQDITNYDVYAQKVNSSGAPQWAANGVAVCTAAGNQVVADVATDAAGGIIAAIKYDDDKRIYGQRITNAGTALWAVNGIAVSVMTDLVFDASIVTDASGNSIFTYAVANTFIKAQKLNTAGLLQWAGAGVIICSATSAAPNFANAVSSDNGSAIITWTDFRNLMLPSGIDAFAEKVLANGTLAGAGVIYISAANGNWNNPATWVGGIVPPAGSQINIRHSIIANVNAVCKNLNIELPGGNLTVVSGVTFTVIN